MTSIIDNSYKRKIIIKININLNIFDRESLQVTFFSSRAILQLIRL